MNISSKYFDIDRNDNVIVKGSFTLVLNESNSDYWYFTTGASDEIWIDDEFLAREKENYMRLVSANKAYDAEQKRRKDIYNKR